MINLKEQEKKIKKAAQFWFDAILNLSNEIRQDNQQRTGISIYIREPETENILHFSIGNPPPKAKDFAIEQAVRSYGLGDVSSQNSEDVNNSHFAGSLMIEINKTSIQVSISGLQSYENVFIAIQLLSVISNESTSSICLDIIDNSGDLPNFTHWYENQLLPRFV